MYLSIYLFIYLSIYLSIANVARKISKSVGEIGKSRFCLPVTSLRTIYYSLVYPYLVHYASVWASTYLTNLSP